MMRSTNLAVILVLNIAAACCWAEEDLSYLQKLNLLNRIIQGYAFEAISDNSTMGMIEPVNLPEALGAAALVEAVIISATKLQKEGFRFNEIWVNPGASISTDPVIVVLVYRKLQILDLYDAEGYTLASPVLGIKVYDAFNLSSTEENAIELDLTAPILVNMPDTSPLGMQPICALFDSEARISVSFPVSDSEACQATRLGDYAQVIPSDAVAPSNPAANAPSNSAANPNPNPNPNPGPNLNPNPSPSPSPSPNLNFSPNPAANPGPNFPFNPPPKSSNPGHLQPKSVKEETGSRLRLGLIGPGFAAAGAAALGVALLVGLAAWRLRTRHLALQHMEQIAARSETSLETSLVAGNKAPTASFSRTRPVLEFDDHS